MEPNKRYDRYRDDDNRTSNFNSGYNRQGDSYERNQGYPDSRFNQYNQRNNPDQYADDRYRNENPYGMNTGYTSSVPNPYSGEYGYNPDPYRNDWQRGNRNYDYRGSGNDWRNREEYKRDRYNQDRNWWDKTTDEVSSWFGDEEAKRRRRMDEINDGMHKGKGPKNYTRSSEKIREDVCEILSDDSHTDASDIDVSVKGTEVTLTGTVESRTMKRRAEDLVERVSGVSHVQNNLRVKEQGTWQDNMAATGSSQSYENAGKNEMSSKTSHTTDTKFSRNAHREQLS
jgi:osmotically-inducible protein OsmY